MASYTNRKGSTYCLHCRQDKAGKGRHVFARTLGAGALDDVPEGYDVQESINGVVTFVGL